MTYILITRFGPTPILIAVTTKCIGVASSHNSVLGKLELFLIDVKSALTADSTCEYVDFYKSENKMNENE